MTLERKLDKVKVRERERKEKGVKKRDGDEIERGRNEKKLRDGKRKGDTRRIRIRKRKERQKIKKNAGKKEIGKKRGKRKFDNRLHDRIQVTFTVYEDCTTESLENVFETMDNSLAMKMQNRRCEALRGKNGLMFGNKPFDVNEADNIIIDGVRYADTRGLYELIFKRILDDLHYTKDDMQVQEYMLLVTNAHKHKHHSQGRILSNRGYKYKHVIAPLMSITLKKQKKSGKRLLHAMIH
ncbi:hypothetical protein ALC53_14060 [Atta colombica]|uniref:DUF8207 domain-containing protein n=1 Tax=Atta colombica TaxID=520822 RepID=A0A151HXV7_9HYME|nr:hypothetical protein ALC53_14060 [Atta colombica]